MNSPRLRLRFARSLSIPVVLALAIPCTIAGEEIVDGRRSIVLQGRQARLVVDILGRSIIDFHLAGHGLNQLRWANDGPGNQPHSISHLWCLDRWGLPAAGTEKC